MILKRTHYLPQGVFGELYTKDGTMICFTLERSYSGKPKIPPGTYPLQFEYSGRFGQDLWELKNVPNVEEAKFHCGNKHTDSDGCILVGLIQDLKNFEVLKSRPALVALHKYLEGETRTTLIIEDELA